jgi:predicted phosphodiesterase
MKFLVVSDLHLEFLNSRYVPPHDDYDAVILAGDIHYGPKAMEWATGAFRADAPVYYVPGNHEYYKGTFAPRLFETQPATEKPSNVHALMRHAHTLGDVRVIGATLWTNYEFGSTETKDVPANMRIAERYMADYRYIMHTDGLRRVTAQDFLIEHNLDVQFITDEITAARAAGLEVLVITHHLPSEKSVAPQFVGNHLNCGFVSNLDHLVERADVWIHGHTHASADYKLGAARVVCNPAGYPVLEDRENPEFDPGLVVEV